MWYGCEFSAVIGFASEEKTARDKGSERERGMVLGGERNLRKEGVEKNKPLKMSAVYSVSEQERLAKKQR